MLYSVCLAEKIAGAHCTIKYELIKAGAEVQQRAKLSKKKRSKYILNLFSRVKRIVLRSNGSSGDALRLIVNFDSKMKKGILQRISKNWEETQMGKLTLISCN